MDAVMEAKLREMLDRHEIWQVMLRYCRGLDRFDREMVRSCYFDDAIDDHDNYVGRPDDFIEYANLTSGYFANCRHGVSNHRCELAGDDAYCETYYMFSGVSGGPTNFISTGRYVDHFQKRAGPNGPEWRIANRVCLIEGKFDVPASRMGADLPPPYTPEEPCQAARDRSDVSYHRPPVPRRPKALA
jgi:hypothetical protein